MTAVLDLFAVFGLPRRFDVDPADLERRFHERSRHLHPDRFARASLAERRIALEQSTQLNDAYRILKQPRSRAAHLLSLLDTGPRSQPTLDGEFLEEQLEIREKLSDARLRGDRAVVDGMAAAARAALAALDEELKQRFACEHPSPEALASIRGALARARYHEAVLAEAEGALPAGSLR